MARYKVFLSVLLFLSIDFIECDSSADSNPVRVVSAAYRRPEMSDSESSGSSIVKKVVKPEFEFGGGGGGGDDDWKQYSMEITREDRMARDEKERQNDKFMKNVPKEYRMMMEDSKRGRDAFTVPSNNNRQRQTGGGGGFAVLDENGNLQVTSAQGGDKIQFNKGEKIRNHRFNAIKNHNERINRERKQVLKSSREIIGNEDNSNNSKKSNNRKQRQLGYTREETVVLSDVMLGGDYEEVQWVDSADNRFYLTTAVPLFEGGEDKVEDTSKDLPPYGPPYHDSGIIAKQATDNKAKNTNQSRKPKKIQGSKGKFAKLSEPVTVRKQQASPRNSITFPGPPPPPVLPRHPQPQLPSQPKDKMVIPFLTSQDETRPDFKKVEGGFVPSQPEVTTEPHPPFPQTHDPNLDRAPPPTRFPPRHKKDFKPSLPEKSRSKPALIDFAKPPPQAEAPPPPRKEFKEIFDAQRENLSGSADGGAVGFQKFSMNGVDVAFDMMAKGDDASGNRNKARNKARQKINKNKLGKRVKITKRKRQRQQIETEANTENIENKPRPERDHGRPVFPNFPHTAAPTHAPPPPHFKHRKHPHAPPPPPPPPPHHSPTPIPLHPVTYGPPLPPQTTAVIATLPGKHSPPPIHHVSHGDGHPPRPLHPIHVNIHIDPRDNATYTRPHGGGHPPLEYQEIELAEDLLRNHGPPPHLPPPSLEHIPLPPIPTHGPPHPVDINLPTAAPIVFHTTTTAAPLPPHHILETPSPLPHIVKTPKPVPHIIHHSEPTPHPFHSTTTVPPSTTVVPVFFHNNDAKINVEAITKAPNIHYLQTTNHPDEVSTLPPRPEVYEKVPVHHPHPPPHPPPPHHPLPHNPPPHHPPLHHPPPPPYHGDHPQLIATTTLPPRQYGEHVTPSIILNTIIGATKKPHHLPHSTTTPVPVYHEKHPHPTPAGIIPDPFELADEIHIGHHYTTTTPAPHLHSTTLGPDLPFIDPKPHRDSMTAVPHLHQHHPTPIPGHPKQYLNQDELRHKFHAAKPHVGSDHPVRSLPIKKKYVHHPTTRPHHHQPGFPLYGSPTTLSPVLLHPDPRTKTGRPKQAKTYPKHNFSTLKPHRPTTVQPKHLLKSKHPYGPSPKPKSLPRLAPTHSSQYDPYVSHHPTPTPFPYIESATAAGFAVFPSAVPPHREVHLAEEAASFQLDPQQPAAELVDDGPRRIVLPTILRSGDLFEGGEGGLIQPTIGPFDDEIGPPPPNVASGFIAPEFLPTTNRFDDGNNGREKKEANISKRSSEEEEDGRDKKKVHKIEITKIRIKS